MARVNSVVIGSGTHKLGEVVLSTVNGQTVARKYQEHIRNPKTEGQTNQRNKMANCILLYQVLSGALDVGFTNRKKQLSVYNAFVSSNIGVMNTKRYDSIDGIIEDAEGPIIVSTGALGFPDVSYSKGTVKIDFTDGKWKIDVGDQIRLFGLNLSGKLVKIVDYTISLSNRTAGIANVPFDGDSRYKCGAIVYTKHGRKSSKAQLIDWMDDNERKSFFGKEK